MHSPAQPHVQLWRVSWLYFFFCSHLIPQTQLKVETLMWCQVRDQFIYTDVLVVSLHLYNLFKIPRFLVSLSCTMSAIRSECQLATTERTKRTERQKWLEMNGGWCYSTAAPLTPASQGLSPLQRFKRSSSHYFGLLHLLFAVLPQLVLWFAPNTCAPAFSPRIKPVLTASVLGGASQPYRSSVWNQRHRICRIGQILFSLIPEQHRQLKWNRQNMAHRR